MRTTLTLEDDVVAQIDEYRKTTGLSLKAAINRVLRTGLEHVDSPPPAPFKTRTVDLGRPLVPNVDDISEALDYAEGDGRQ